MKGVLLAAVLATVVPSVALGQAMFSPDAMVQAIPPVLHDLAKLPAAETVVIKYGLGGRIDEHQHRYAGYRSTKAKVEVRGQCLSACTLITAYIPKERLCFAPGAFLAFHMAHRNGVIAAVATMEMYESYPADIRAWIDHQGGWRKLKIETYWTMYDRDLWAIGYPRCTP